MLTETEVIRRNFNRALSAIHRGKPVASRKIAKAAKSFEDREAALEEREARSAFTDAYVAMTTRGRKVAKVAVAETDDDAEHRLVTKAINDIHAGRKLIAKKIAEIDRTVQKSVPAFRYH